MTRRVIVDSGPLVAFLDRREAHHAWIAEQAKDAPLAVALVRSSLGRVLAPAAQIATCSRCDAADGREPALESGVALPSEIGQVRLLREKYRDIPMSLADACLVRMAEKFGDCAVCTLDSDFTIYKKHRREPIPLITPFGS